MIDDVGKFCDNKLLEYEEKQNKKSSVDVLKEMRDNFSAMSKVSFGGTLIKQTNALSDGVVALEKLEKLKEWLIKSEDDFQLLRISVTGDKLKCWYLDGQFKILEEVRLLL